MLWKVLAETCAKKLILASHRPLFCLQVILRAYVPGSAWTQQQKEVCGISLSWPHQPGAMGVTPAVGREEGF